MSRHLYPIQASHHILRNHTTPGDRLVSSAVGRHGTKAYNQTRVLTLGFLMLGTRSLVTIAVVLAVVLGAGIVYAVVFYLPNQGAAQTRTAVAYQIEIEPLNHSVTAVSGSTIVLLFNVTSPQTGALYFYASAIPSPGMPWEMNLQNVTTGNVELPQGVRVSFPTGQAVFGSDHATLTLQVTFSSDLNGTVGLVVGAFQQANQEQVVGTGSGVYITVKSET